MEIRKLSELKATNPYLRLGTDVTDLEKSIQTLGLIAPLVISTDNVILAGARRYQALLNLGHTQAPVMVVDNTPLVKELVSIDENLVRKKKTTLPAEKFLNMVSEKTGLSPKQIHEAINRDEMASHEVKEARLNGELSLSQTNEIVKLTKNDQKIAIDHIKELPVREIKNFVKLAKTQGVEKAIIATPTQPLQKEFQEIDQSLRKLIKKFKQFQLEGIDLADCPEEIRKLFRDLMKFSDTEDFSSSSRNDEAEMGSFQ